MTIKRLESAEEIAKLLGVEDDVEKYLPCTHGEWIQWLVSQVDNPRIVVWGNLDEEDVVDSYFVGFNRMLPPLSKHCSIFYTWDASEHEGRTRAMVSTIEEWAKIIGTLAIRVLPPGEHVDVFEKCGFKKTAVMMEVDLRKIQECC